MSLDNHCATCGAYVERPGEFHPHAFCIWKKAGQDPWALLLWVNERLGVDVTHWPKQPPLVKDLPKGEGCGATTSADLIKDALRVYDSQKPPRAHQDALDFIADVRFALGGHHVAFPEKKGDRRFDRSAEEGPWKR